MYFLKPLCLICLNMERDLHIINMEMLTKLLYCIEKTEEFIPDISNRKICKDCSQKLDIAFHFKKMCLKNIVQFKDYVDQLKQASSSPDAFHFIKLELIDIKHQEVKVESSSEQCLDMQIESVIIKQEVTHDFDCKNNLTQEEHPNEELEKLIPKEEMVEVCEEQELENSECELNSSVIHQNNSCSICGKSFRNKFTLKKHMFLHSEERPYSCGICEKSFAVKAHLKVHMIIHSSQRPHSCSVCGKSFKDKGNMKKHMIVHTKEKPHSCSICEKSFALKSNLKQHIAFVHNNERHYPCTICEKRFITKFLLNKHMFVHNLLEPQCCTICGKGYADNYKLKMHMLVHSTERPYSCTICSRSFVYNTNLKRHLLTHTNERPHSCSECGKSFTLKCTLKNHIMLIHKNERPFSCSTCEKRFARKYLLARHMSVHIEKLNHSSSNSEGIEENTV